MWKENNIRWQAVRVIGSFRFPWAPICEEGPPRLLVLSWHTHILAHTNCFMVSVVYYGSVKRGECAKCCKISCHWWFRWVWLPIEMIMIIIYDSFGIIAFRAISLSAITWRIYVVGLEWRRRQDGDRGLLSGRLECDPCGIINGPFW